MHGMTLFHPFSSGEFHSIAEYLLYCSDDNAACLADIVLIPEIRGGKDQGHSRLYRDMSVTAQVWQ